MMAEYPVKSTLQGTYGRIEQRSEVKRETYKMCRAGGREDWSWKPLVYIIVFIFIKYKYMFYLLKYIYFYYIFLYKKNY